jgi:hypothetical protein
MPGALTRRTGVAHVSITGRLGYQATLDRGAITKPAR